MTPALGSERITDLKRQIAGSNWLAEMGKPLRTGFSTVLLFSPTLMEPSGLKYEVNSSTTLTVHLDKGDTQIFRLEPDGKHLQLTWNNQDYRYELRCIGQSADFDLRPKLAGSTWNAIPNRQLRPGMAKTLTFTDKIIGPAGYTYTVSGINTITLWFPRGDSQFIKLSENGKNLNFNWFGVDYGYERSGR